MAYWLFFAMGVTSLCIPFKDPASAMYCIAAALFYIAAAMRDLKEDE